MMFTRPKSNQTEEDLLRENEELMKKQGASKRKVNDDSVLDEGENRPRKSRYALKKEKKRKEKIIDYTVLVEAEANRDSKVKVCLGIVEENVSLGVGEPMTWNPTVRSKGFPNPPKMTLEEMDTYDEMQNTPEHKGKTMYQLHLEKLGLWKCKEKSEEDIPKQDDWLEDLANRGALSVSTDLQEASSLHDENMALLSRWSHEKRLQERDELLRELKPEYIDAIKKLRKPKVTSDNEAMEIAHSTENITDFTPKSDVTPESGKWLNMNRLEPDKLKWMSELPPPKPMNKSEGFIARFNFEGNLLPYNTDISVYEGLHHHGEEPERAGYSLDELFILTRSRVVQQRHIGLKVIANILRNAKEGLYDSCFDEPILQTLVNSGIVFLLRFSIDESTALVYEEAIRALYYLVCNEPDEHCLSMVDGWIPHLIVPGISSKANNKEKDRKELDDEAESLQDTEIIQLDLIRALVRMDLLLRFRYFIETIRPAPNVLMHIFGILIRIARHSLSLSWDIFRCPRLMEEIVKNFVPSVVKDGNPVSSLTATYGLPLKLALTLLKVLSQRGRELANYISRIPGLLNTLSVYISLDPTRSILPVQETLSISVESYSLMSVLLSYGHVKPQETFQSLKPVLMKKLQFYLDKIDIILSEENNHNYDIGTQLINFLTIGLHVASTEELLKQRYNANQHSRLDSQNNPEVLVPPILSWGDVDYPLLIIESCLKKWLYQVARDGANFSGYRLVGATCRYLEVYTENWAYQSSFNMQSAIKITKDISDHVIQFLKSSRIQILLKELKKYSNFCFSNKLEGRRDPDNLESLETITMGGTVIPILQRETPFPLLSPLSSLIATLVSSDTSLLPLLNNLETGSLFIDYIAAINESNLQLASHWFTRIELHTFTNFAKVFASQTCNLEFHNACIRLIQFVQPGDEHLIRTLLDIICKHEAVFDVVSFEKQIEGIDLCTPLPSPAISQPIIASTQLATDLYESISTIRSVVSSFFADDLTYKSSLAMKRLIPFLINAFTVQYTSELPLNEYWPLQFKKFTTDTVLRGLQMTYLLLKYRKAVSGIPIGWIRWLTRVFICSNDLFLDVKISSYLQACLREILAHGKYSTLDYTIKLNGFQSCFDWFRQLINQYMGTSYGDSTFSLCILIPIQMYWPLSYRELLWGEHMDVLRLIRITYEQVHQFIPITQFLEPAETDENMIKCYQRALLTKAVHQKSVLYCIANHHVAEYKQRRSVAVKM